MDIFEDMIVFQVANFDRFTDLICFVHVKHTNFLLKAHLEVTDTHRINFQFHFWCHIFGRLGNRQIPDSRNLWFFIDFKAKKNSWVDPLPKIDLAILVALTAIFGVELFESCQKRVLDKSQPYDNNGFSQAALRSLQMSMPEAGGV